MKGILKQGSGSTSLLGWAALVLILIGAAMYISNALSGPSAPSAPNQDIPVPGGVEHGIPQ